MRIRAGAGVDVPQGAGVRGRIDDPLLAGRLGDEGVNGWLETAESDQDARLLDGADIGGGGVRRGGVGAPRGASSAMTAARRRSRERVVAANAEMVETNRRVDDERREEPQRAPRTGAAARDRAGRGAPRRRALLRDSADAT